MKRHPFHRPAALAAAGALILALAASPAAALPLDRAHDLWGQLWGAALHVLAAAWGPAPAAASRPELAVKHGPEWDPLGTPASGQDEGDSGGAEVTGQNGPEWDPFG